MILLAIDTSTTAITVAIHDGSAVLAEVTTLDARAHAEHLAPNIVTALADARLQVADLTDVAVGIGPGPFTGLRVGIVTGRTLAFARGIPVHGVPSLDALAWEHWWTGARGPVLVATDARRKEVYWAAYLLTDQGIDRYAGPSVGRAGSLPEEVRGLPCVGRGARLYAEALPHAVGPLDVSGGALAALAVARLAAGVDLGDLEPIYLRRPDAVASVPVVAPVMVPGVAEAPAGGSS